MGNLHRSQLIAGKGQERFLTGRNDRMAKALKYGLVNLWLNKSI